jgi:hypothetical protein
MLREILQAHARGDLSEGDAQKAIRDTFERDLGFARIDTDRANRRGFPEVVYGGGKTTDQLRGIVDTLLSTHKNILCTRVSADAGAVLMDEFEEIRYDEVARLAYAHGDLEIRGQGVIGLVAAGTSDLPVAREAELCAKVMGNEVRTWTDVGVAGLHRLLGVLDEIREARVVVTVAGMEAALPSVLAGLLARPVVSIPTSVGYGASFDGLAALLSSLTSCAPGVVTVNIDNGFGAAYAASLMNRP